TSKEKKKKEEDDEKEETEAERTLVSTSSSSSSLFLDDIVFNMIGVVHPGNIKLYLKKPFSNRRSRVSIARLRSSTSTVLKTKL
ncbi:hypothetical protein ALC53_10510, partial [Atta colombica]